MAHKDDVGFVLMGPNGDWLSANIGGRSVVGEELKDIQKTIEGRGGLNKDAKFGVAQNDPTLNIPPPSSQDPWLPVIRKKRKRRPK